METPTDWFVDRSEAVIGISGVALLLGKKPAPVIELRVYQHMFQLMIRQKFVCNFFFRLDHYDNMDEIQNLLSKEGYFFKVNTSSCK